MSYKALYRKYRPQSFADVSDQEHVTRTLKNAITENKISHAYLFTGPRGIGKTTIAKIFAKAINCPNGKDGEPCNECEICKETQEASVSDIIEIDAASNNGVEQIRTLRDNTKFLPTLCKYKVYIVDEVHMLSTSAFNALLKTLEEPPKHIIFILCTTEPQKVPQTIQSRCQRFDFHLISDQGIIERIKHISKIENIKINDNAVELIAQVAEGGMRDALSLLDQVSAFSTSDEITVDDVLAVSGKVSTDILIKMGKALSENNSLEAINLLDGMLKIGKEIPRILYGLIVFFKDILVIKNVGIEVRKVGYNSKEFVNLQMSLSNSKLYKYIEILTQAQNDMRYSQNQRLYLELAFIKMTDKELFLEIPEKVQKVAPKVEPKIERTVEPKPVINPLPFERIEEPKKEDAVPQKVKKEEPKPVIEEKEAVVEFVQEEAPQEEPKKEEKAPQNQEETYDIHFIEEILNKASKPTKEEMIKRLPEVLKKAKTTEFRRYIPHLEDGEISASSTSAIVLTFPEVSECNLAMKKDEKEGIKGILKMVFDREFDLIAIPKEIWKTISTEFVQKYRENVNNKKFDYINLTYVPCPGLVSTSGQMKEQTIDEKYKDLIDLFGDDIVSIK